ncbi:MAG: hypothetical protein C4575_07105 [Desulforudis sp.]|nr:MAG: hypothetical protein C4575_07105 [Desulforudis sp.]
MLMSVGIAGVVFALTWLLLAHKRPKAPRIKAPPLKIRPASDSRYAPWVAGGVVAATLLTQGQYGFNTIVFGAVAGGIVGHVFILASAHGRKMRRLRETAVLYLLVELGLRAGYTLPASLRGAMPMTPALAPHVARCLEIWDRSPIQALETLRQAINLPEADTLVSLLMQVQEMGSGRLGGAMEEGSKQLQSLRRALVRSQAASRPLAFAVFRMLPVLGVVGLVLGPLMMVVLSRLSQMLTVF